MNVANTSSINVTELLRPLRARGGKALTVGLDQATLLRVLSEPQFAQVAADLRLAASEAVSAFRKFSVDFPELLDQDETNQLAVLQAGLVNFYAADNVNPYVAIAARGPWIITLKGAVLHDSGGYGPTSGLWKFLKPAR